MRNFICLLLLVLCCSLVGCGEPKLDISDSESVITMIEKCPNEDAITFMAALTLLPESGISRSSCNGLTAKELRSKVKKKVGSDRMRQVVQKLQSEMKANSYTIDDLKQEVILSMRSAF